MNSDDTFELRWVDYYSIRFDFVSLNRFSGFDEIMNMEEGTKPPIFYNSSGSPEKKREDFKEPATLSVKEQDEILENKIKEIMQCMLFWCLIFR